MTTTNYRLYKNHFLCTRSDRPVLLSEDAVSGAYHQSSTPPGCADAAYNIVLRALAGEPLPNDPKISCEDGGDFVQWALQWLQIREDEIERARLIVKIADGGKK